MTFHLPGKKLMCLECDRPAAARKLCKSHYYKAVRAGRIHGFQKLKPDDVFESRIDKSGSCWLWTGTKNQSGYGVLHVDGDKRARAHRYAYEKWVGPIPSGKILLHSCDNPACVNPAHLTPGTRRDNLYDAMAKGRRATGDAHWNTKIPETIVMEIRSLDVPVSYWVQKLGVNQSTISRIKTRHRRGK